jgi:hypothetical protein
MLILALLLIGCNHSHYDFNGKWQSLNDPDVLIEFQDNTVSLLTAQQPLWNAVSQSGFLRYELQSERPNWYHLQVFDNDALFVHGKIEVVNDFRIRVYLYKHHDILDVADEFHRTKGLNTYRELLDSIAHLPE